VVNISVVMGVDVSKLTLSAALWIVSAQRWIKHKATVPNSAAGVQTLLAWAVKESGVTLSDLRVTMEATGQYHENTAHYFHEAGCFVIVANPKQASDYLSYLRKNKTDATDAQGLARLGTEPDLHRWCPPSPELRAVDSLLAHLGALTKNGTACKNRVEAATTGRAHPEVLASLRRLAAFLRDEQRRIRATLKTHYKAHPSLAEAHKLLTSIPGVGDLAARHLLVHLRTRQITSARQAAALAGLVPVFTDSGTSVHEKPKLPHLSGDLMRTVLYMGALSASHRHPVMRAVYAKLAKDKPAKVALCAMMRRIVHIAYGVLRTGTPFDAERVVQSAKVIPFPALKRPASANAAKVRAA
jgi:transposase